MATRDLGQIIPKLGSANGYDTVITTWNGLLNGDVGAPLSMPHFPDTTVQMLGTPGSGGAIVWEGSNVGGVDANWFTLRDSQGNPVSLTAPGGRFITECCLFLRPRVPSGDGTTNWTVVLLSRRQT